MNNPCEKMRDRIADYILGTLSREEINALDEHMTSCPQCKKYAEALQNEKHLLLQLGENLDKEMSVREDKVIEALEQVSCKKIKPPSVLRVIVKSPVVKFAAAACVIIAVLVVTHQFGIKVASASTTWADVLRNMYQATTVVFEQTFETGGYKQKSKVMVNEFGVKRFDDEGGVLLLDFPNGVDLALDPNTKRAHITHRIGNPMQGKPFNVLKLITRLKNAGKLIGQQELDGKTTDVYVFEKPFEKNTVWVDVQTNLPVRYEKTQVPNTNKDIIMPKMSLSLKDFGGDSNDSSGICIGGGWGIIDKPITITMSSFQWNAELDTSLFNMTPPADYTVDETQMDVSYGNKNHLIDALAFWAGMSEGMFPDKINDLGDPNKVKPLLIRKFYKGVSPKTEFNLAFKEMNTILNALNMVQEQKAQGTWGYAGQGVKLGQVNTPICWWKPEDSEKWHVIYADLSIKDVNAADLPNPK